MSKTSEISFKITPSNLSSIISVLKDLSIISEKALFKINKKNILIYTLVGEGTGINTFKSFVFKTSELFEIDDFEETIDFIAKDIKKVYRNLQIIVDINNDISGKIYYDQIGDKFWSDRMFFKSDTKLKLNLYGSDPMAFNTSITIEDIKKLTNINNAIFDFNLSESDFTNIKRLSVSDKDADVFYMNTFEKDGNNYISIGESGWDLTLGEISFDQARTLSFPKKYFKTINVSGGEAKVYVFDRFLMISKDNSSLLISTEISA